MNLYEKSTAVDQDWQQIITYTLEQYGEAQAYKYTQQLLKCINAMAIGKGHYKDHKVSPHLVRVKHCQKHYIFGLIKENEPMLIIAIFHEKMQLMARLKKRLL